VASVPSTLLTGLRSTPGVSAVLLVHGQPSTASVLAPGLVSCADLAQAPALGHCRPGAQAASIDTELAGSKFQRPTWPPADISPSALARMPVEHIVVVTNGSRAAVERARTLLELAYPQTDSPSTVAEWQADNGKRTAAYQQLANVVIIASLPIAGCTLAVSVVAGLNERKRLPGRPPFPALTDARDIAAAGRSLLGLRGGRTHRVAGDHCVDAAGAAADQRARERP